MRNSLSDRLQKLTSLTFQEVTAFEKHFISLSSFLERKPKWNEKQFPTYKSLKSKIKDLDSEGGLGLSDESENEYRGTGTITLNLIMLVRWIRKMQYQTTSLQMTIS